jgi:hypothetical protein
MPDTLRTPPRRLRLLLRDFRMLEGSVSLPDGQSLTSFLSSRKSYLHLQDVRWTNTGERASFAVLRVAQLLWAASPDGDVTLVSASLSPEPRVVEIQVDGGLLVRAALHIGARQRLGDYLEAAGPFVPLGNAHLLRSGRPAKKANLILGDIVLHQDGIQAVWETSVAAHQAETERAQEDAVPSWGTLDLVLENPAA